MRKKIVAGNWKMNLNYAEALTLVDSITDPIGKVDSCEVILAPPFVYIHEVLARVQRHAGFSVAAQDCSEFSKGAYTGQVSAGMLASIGTDYVIIGHSERRALFQEKGEQLTRKLVCVLENSMLPIFCCGETFEERKNGSHFSRIKAQLETELFQLDSNQIENVVVAYEPVWAIGTGLNATAVQAQEMHAFIRNEIGLKYGAFAASVIPILYGGSITSKNSDELFSCQDVDGGLVGGASLKPEEFVSIVKSCMTRKSRN